LRTPGAGQRRNREGRGLSIAVPVPMMNVRVVWMSVFQAGVDVFVRVRFAGRIVRSVRVLVMVVVGVAVFVDHAVVDVRVIVPLGQVQIDAGQHQRAGCDQLQR
jgi:hypothetical protein